MAKARLAAMTAAVAMAVGVAAGVPVPVQAATVNYKWAPGNLYCYQNFGWNNEYRMHAYRINQHYTDKNTNNVFEAHYTVERWNGWFYTPVSGDLYTSTPFVTRAAFDGNYWNANYQCGMLFNWWNGSWTNV